MNPLNCNVRKEEAEVAARGRGLDRLTDPPGNSIQLAGVVNEDGAEGVVLVDGHSKQLHQLLDGPLALDAVPDALLQYLRKQGIDARFRDLNHLQLPAKAGASTAWSPPPSPAPLQAQRPERSQ